MVEALVRLRRDVDQTRLEHDLALTGVGSRATHRYAVRRSWAVVVSDGSLRWGRLDAPLPGTEVRFLASDITSRHDDELKWKNNGRLIGIKMLGLFLDVSSCLVQEINSILLKTADSPLRGHSFHGVLQVAVTSV